MISNNKRGFIEVEFIISVMLFLTVIVFIVVSISREIPSLENRANIDNIRANGYAVSQLLLFDKGEPQDWGALAGYDKIRRIGLSSGEPYILSMNKINKLENFCRDMGYQNLMAMFNQNEINITVKYLGDCLADCSLVMSCGIGSKRPDNATSNVKFIINRFGVADNRIVNVTIAIYGAA